MKVTVSPCFVFYKAPHFIGHISKLNCTMTYRITPPDIYSFFFFFLLSFFSFFLGGLIPIHDQMAATQKVFDAAHSDIPRKTDDVVSIDMQDTLCFIPNP